jgi:hypothetical protein
MPIIKTSGRNYILVKNGDTGLIVLYSSIRCLLKFCNLHKKPKFYLGAHLNHVYAEYQSHQ